MNRKELLQYAVKGLSTEIAEHEERLMKGYNYLDKLNRGESLKSGKTREEIIDIINEKEQIINELIKKRENLLWEEAMLEDTEKERRRAENIIKVGLSSILSQDTESLGSLFLEEIAKLLDKLALQPFCEAIGKRYEELTAEDFNIIAEMREADYISREEAKEIEERENDNE